MVPWVSNHFFRPFRSDRERVRYADKRRNARRWESPAEPRSTLFLALLTLTWPGPPVSRAQTPREVRFFATATATTDLRNVKPLRPHAPSTLESTPDDPAADALRLIAGCQERYKTVQDYSCTFTKRERLDGRLSPPHVMVMKVRTRPMSVYLRFLQPEPGREAIWIAGRNSGKAVVHDVGITKFLTGTLYLDPNGTMAMEGNRHPITQAGIGNLINTVATRWETELRPGNKTQLVIYPDTRLGDRSCTLIASTHPQRSPGYLFHAIKLYIDREYGLPIRIESYDWPRRPGLAPDLPRGIHVCPPAPERRADRADFDPANGQYSFGHF